MAPAGDGDRSAAGGGARQAMPAGGSRPSADGDAKPEAVPRMELFAGAGTTGGDSGGAARSPGIFAGAGAETAASFADVEIDVRADARELRARSHPRSRSEPEGGPNVVADRMTQRRNLPKRLEPGRVARDVAVRRRVAARLRAGGG